MTLPPQLPHRLGTETFCQWLEGQLVSIGGAFGSQVVVVRGRVADMPNLSASVVISGPSAVQMEAVLETVGVHIQTRGHPNNIDSSESLALLVDDIILNSENNFQMIRQGESSGVYVKSMYRPGQRPQQLNYLDVGDRFVFSANYTVQCSTGAN